MLFNQNEFHAIWKRSKERNEKVEELGTPVSLEFNQLLNLLLVNDFKTKPRYGLEQNVPLSKSLSKPEPSYRISHWKEHEHWEK